MNRRVMAWVVAVTAAWSGLAGAAELGRSAPPTQNTSGGFGGNPATGLQLSLFPPVQIFPENYDVSGFRLSLIYGRNENLRGFDLGLVNQVNGLTEGFQLGLGNMTEELSGLQVGLFNRARSSDGLFQLGLVNMGDDINGFQLGLFNMCHTLSGVQIGLLNFITQSEFVIFCPIVNAHF